MTVHDLGCNRKLIFNFQQMYIFFHWVKYLFWKIDIHEFYFNGKTFSRQSFTLDASFQEFVNSPCMTEIKERSCFIHIDVPGHADNEETLPDSWVYSFFKLFILKFVPIYFLDSKCLYLVLVLHIHHWKHLVKIWWLYWISCTWNTSLDWERYFIE